MEMDSDTTSSKPTLDIERDHRVVDEFVAATGKNAESTDNVAPAKAEEANNTDDAPAETDDDYPPPAAVSGPGIELYSPVDLSAFIATNARSSTDHEVSGRNRALARNLSARGPFRPLWQLPDDWERQLDGVEFDYPHFAVFFSYLRTMCLLAVLDNRVLEMECALLDGEPGTGKSTVLERLKGILFGAYVRVSMSAAESGAYLGGSQETWSNSKPGLVFTTMTEGKFANAAFNLDELDKVSRDPRLDPLGPCYQLLEPALAKHFADLSVPAIPIDASRIVWFATSNDASIIPEAIRQRFVQFNIPLPTPAQSLAVLRSVVRWLQSEHPRLGAFTLDDSAEEALIGLAPRVMRKQITQGCGHAARDGRRVVMAADFPVDNAETRRVGFY